MLRESSSAPELLLVKRRAGDAFGDSYTFPGGVVDDDESAAHAFSQGKTADEANALLNVSQGGLDYYSAAIRELFEETGILLVRDSAGDWICGGPELGALRRKVDQGVLPWSDFLREQGLRIALDALHYFAHWETPLNLPKRWSTRFFLADHLFGDSYTFPGGVVDDDESAAHAFSQGKTADEANALLNVSQGGLDYYSAAIRELFEETGILLVRDSAGDWICGGPELGALRRKVDQGVLPWSDFLREQGLRIALDALHYFAHWETPLNLPKRWSTRFFLAELPPGQDATHDGSEVTDSRWIPAAEALALGRDGV